MLAKKKGEKRRMKEKVKQMEEVLKELVRKAYGIEDCGGDYDAVMCQDCTGDLCTECKNGITLLKSLKGGN